MTEFQMKAIRYRQQEVDANGKILEGGVRNGILVGEGPKWLRVIFPDCRGIRVTELPVSDRKFMTDLDIPVRRALDNLRVHARLVGCLKSAADVLGMRPIDPPRDEESNSPTLNDLRKEYQNMARSVPKSKKPTDKTKREKKIATTTKSSPKWQLLLDALKKAGKTGLSVQELAVAIESTPASVNCYLQYLRKGDRGCPKTKLESARDDKITRYTLAA